MTADEAIAFLERHQPMPSDHRITEKEGAMFAAILKFFEAHPDKRSIPLLLGSVSADTGLGMYEHIKFVLLRHQKEEVTPHLRRVLVTGSDAQKARCCWWAADLGAWTLRDEVAIALKSEDEDLKDAAAAFFELQK